MASRYEGGERLSDVWRREWRADDLVVMDDDGALLLLVLVLVVGVGVGFGADGLESLFLVAELILP